MTLPRLQAGLRDNRAVARLLRGALRHEVVVVPLSSAPPEAAGQHLLDIEITGEGVVTLLADPMGAATSEGQPLHVRPMTRPQMAALFALVERLDEPSQTAPPPANSRWPSERPTGVSDSTLVDKSSDAPPSPKFSGPPSFGLFGKLSPFPRGVASIEPPRFSRPVPPRLLIGRIVAGKYEIDSPIGSGSTASVYKATHLDLKRLVAVKILHEQKLSEAHFVKRFTGEALAASKLEHQNITRVIDFGQESDGLLYIVMELLSGRTLEAILAASGSLPQRIAVAIVAQAANAVAVAHDVGIIHRDLKPENIMIVAGRDDDGNPCDVVKVCDFGLAKHEVPADESELTMSGLVCGSPAYMSPEQTRGDVIDVRTDVYSLGVTLFETLTDALPHDDEDLAELFRKKMAVPPRKLLELVPDIHPTLQEIVERALCPDPAGRYATARALRDDLRELLFLLEAGEESRRHR